MKSTLTLRISLKRLFLLTVVSLVAVAALLGIAASANKANRAAKAQQARAANSISAINPLSTTRAGMQPAAPLAANITATLTDNIPAATKVAPGGTINYTAVITNAGAASPADDALSLVYNGTLDTNTTIVPGSVSVSPVAFNDTYPQTVIGNVSINSANIPYSVVTNDYQGQNGGALTITAFDATTTQGGQIVMTIAGVDIGKFTYNPPPGFEGTDTFTYTFTNSVGSSVGTVSIPVSGMVWFINNNSPACTTLAAGCGRLSNPFSSLAAFQALNNGTGNNPAINDNIFVFESATTYTGGVTLLGGQKFIGQDATDSLATITGLTPLSGSTAFPAMNTGAPATTITNAGGAGITLNNTTTSNTIRGMTISNTSTAKISGSSFGTLTVGKSGSPDVTLSGTGQALNLTTGTFAATSAFTSVAATSSTTTGMSMTSVGGTVAFGSTTTSSTTNQGIFVTTSTVNIDFGNTSVTTSGGTGVNLVTNTGTATFGSLTITPNSGQRGLHATGQTSGALTTTSGTITTTNATAVEIAGTSSASRTPLNVQLTTVNTTGGSVAPNGIALTNTSATGSPGGFRVLGTGGTCTFSTPTCTGGRITATTGAEDISPEDNGGVGVRLNNANQVFLTRMRIDNHPNFAVAGANIVGLNIDLSVIDGNNGNNAAFEEGAIGLRELTGTTGAGTSSNITNCFIGGGFEFLIDVRNFNGGTLDRLTVSNNTIGDLDGAGAGYGVHVSGGDDAIHFEGFGVGATFKVTANNNVLNSGRGDVVNFNAGTAGNTITSDFVFRNNTVTNTHPAILSGGGGATVTMGGGAAITSTYDISCNKFTGAKGFGLLVAKTLGSGTAQGSIFNNRIGTSGVAGSSSTEASGIDVDSRGSGTHTVLIKNNIVTDWGANGAFQIFNNQGSVTMNVTVQGNTSDNPHPANGLAGLYAEVGALAGDTSVLNMLVGGAGAAENNFVDGDPFDGNDVLLSRIAGAGTVFNLSRGVSAASSVQQIITDNNVDPVTAAGAGTITFVNTTPALPPATSEACSPPPVPPLGDEAGNDLISRVSNDSAFQGSSYQKDVTAGTPTEIPPVAALGTPPAPMVANVDRPAVHTDRASNSSDAQSFHPARFHHAQFKRWQISKASAAGNQPLGPLSGEAVGPINIGTLPAGKSVTITYQATVDTPPSARQASHQGTVTFTGGLGSPLLTDDPEPAGAANPTVTLIETLVTWNGSTNTDWNTATNWTPPAGGTQYAPGVSNPAVNDVVIPNVGAQPNISATDIGIFSLNLSNGRTLTITSPRVLTIGGSPGGDLTLDGIISGGNLNLGTGTHVINNAGGTGSLSATNVATVLSGSTVTLNNNLQAGALAVNAGGSIDITNRTLSLNGSGAALAVPGGATFTTTGSTVVFNGTAAQQAAGIAYNNLTINNTIGTNVTGVMLTGNATVNGTLALTSSDLATSTFTLTQPNTTASTGVSDVVGTVRRTGGPFAPAVALTFGNPNNRITFTAAGTKPTDVTVVMAKTAPATYAAAVQRNYTISQTGGSGFTSTLRLHYLDSELNGNTPETDLNLRRFRTSDGHWTAALPTVVDAANNWVECNAVTDTILSTQWTFSSLVPTAADGAVTGRIVDSNGVPIEGAVVRLTGTQNRKLITDANGFYRFENVETNGFYTVTPARVNFSFSPSQRSFSQLGSSTEAGFTGSSAGESANPLDTAEYFVRQQYVDLLGREPDESGFNYWSDRILECDSDALCVNSRRKDVAAAFFVEQEFQRTGSFIYGLYKGSLSRRPGYAEFSADRRQVVEGPTLEATKQAFAESFVSRAEFTSKYQGTNSAESFVDALLGTVSQSSGIDLSSERANLISRYQAGASLVQSRSFVLRGVIDNAGFRQAEYNRTFVLAEYFGYLRRDPDQGGYDFWLDVVSNRDVNNYRSMVCAFISSPEYQRRFSSIVSRNDRDCGQ